MRVKSVWIVVMMSLLAGCQRERNTITGGYGNSVISGEVVMAGGGSAAGVEVSTPDTGMATVLGENGQFSFMDVPEGTTLRFRRAADGIDASLRVDKSASPLVVELAQSNATPTGSSRRRSAGRGTESVFEFEGLLKSASADRMVVTTERGDVSIGVNAQTIVKKNDQDTPLGGLIGLRVLVKAHKEGDAYLAIVVLARDAEHNETRTYQGTVRSASVDRLVVITRDGEVSFLLNALTKVTKADQPATIADLQAGQNVYVGALVAPDGTKTATRIAILRVPHPPPPVARTYQGTVRTASTDRLTITTRDGDVSFVLNALTKVTKGDQPVTIADLQAGQEVYVGALVASDGTKTAVRVAILPPPPPVTRTYHGTVRTVSPDRLAILTGDGEVSFLLNASTKVTRGDQPATLADVQTGMSVYVGALVATDGTKTATRINIQVQIDPPPPVLKTYEGTVRSVSPDRLVIGTRDGEVSMLLNALTRITKGTDQPATIADLQVGQHVYAGALVASTGAKTAVRVAILP